ncbi:MAG TPA: N-acetylmuramoyl-L-alanine amidase [Thermoanaerobaculia bacterium]|nr:N-acetylmuramoyl-L-alanine amidase [Thermoanaerobaculia bacterium]
MRKWWVGLLGALLPAAVLAASPFKTVTPELRASLTADYTIEVVVTPHDGDAWSRLAKRVTGDGDRWNEIAAFNHAGGNLTTEQRVRIPFNLLRPNLQRDVAAALFPSDSDTAAGRRHVVVGSNGVEGESLWNIAEWFTGRGENYAAIRAANSSQGLSTRKGDVILIPKELLTAAFRRGEMEERNAPKTAEVRKSEDDPEERAGADGHAAAAVSLPEAVAVPGQPSLTYDRTSGEPFAVYRLQKGEALYSSVAIRFTGRVYSKDVGDVLDRIVKFNGIDDVARIPIGYRVKIPMSLLLPEYLAADDPARVASEEAKRTSAKLAVRPRAKGLAGVHVILDAGHGGRDVGATYDDVWESNYVYDVMCRLKHILEKKSGATVAATTKSKQAGYDVPDDDELEEATDHIVLTSPKYVIGDPAVGVNLRWYLANSIFRRAMKATVPREKVVFISLHADSLHPSLRGAMAYIPGQRYVTGSYETSDQVYLARAEVRESPVVRHSEKESLTAEGLSRDLAESIIDAFDADGLKVHPFNPVRDNVVRNGREWVPAVIRYNLIPTRLLLEICNLGNDKDRALIKTKKYRQRVAEAIYQGLVNYYNDREDDRPAPAIASGR